MGKKAAMHMTSYLRITDHIKESPIALGQVTTVIHRSICGRDTESKYAYWVMTNISGIIEHRKYSALGLAHYLSTKKR